MLLFIGRTIEWANYSLGFDSNNPYRLRRFALLCEFLQYNQTLLVKEQTQILQNPPSQLLTLADLFGLSDWIAQFIPQNGNR